QEIPVCPPASFCIQFCATDFFAQSRPYSTDLPLLAFDKIKDSSLSTGAFRT
ncbi:13069_t:CDS:1, partial [Dentiscutata erythropus]